MTDAAVGVVPSSVRSSSRRSSGLPPVVSKAASTTVLVGVDDPADRVERERAGPHELDRGRGGEAGQQGVLGAGLARSAGRSATSTGSSSTRRARKSTKRRLGASAQWASSITSSSGCSSASDATSQ